MEGLSQRRGRIGWPKTAAAALSAALLLVIVPQVSSLRYIVGAMDGWGPNVNFTIWAQGKHFYNGDWLYFVYDRNQMNVLEVNKTDYELCNSDHPLHNWTTGAGRDVVPLNVTKTYYFISGKGFCFRGMKVAVHVENPPPPPTSSPQKSDSPPTQKSDSPLPPPTSSPQKSDSPPPPPTSSPQKSDSPPPPPTSSLRKSDSLPPPPTSSPQKSDSPGLLSTFGGQIFIPTLFAAARIWDAFILQLLWNRS